MSLTKSHNAIEERVFIYKFVHLNLHLKKTSLQKIFITNFALEVTNALTSEVVLLRSCLSAQSIVFDYSYPSFEHLQYTFNFFILL